MVRQPHILLFHAICQLPAFSSFLFHSFGVFTVNMEWLFGNVVDGFFDRNDASIFGLGYKSVGRNGILGSGATRRLLGSRSKGGWKLYTQAAKMWIGLWRILLSSWWLSFMRLDYARITS
jgi:hypothetical protein